MSNNSEKLRALIEQVAELKNLQELKVLLESMGFFALKEAIEEYFLTIKDQKTTLKSYAHGLITALLETGSKIKLINPTKRINKKIRLSFSQ